MILHCSNQFVLVVFGNFECVLWFVKCLCHCFGNFWGKIKFEQKYQKFSKMTLQTALFKPPKVYVWLNALQSLYKHIIHVNFFFCQPPTVPDALYSIWATWAFMVSHIFDLKYVYKNTLRHCIFSQNIFITQYLKNDFTTYFKKEIQAVMKA